MNSRVKEAAGLLVVLFFASSLFLAIPRAFPHVVSYKYALEAKKAIESGSGGQPFYELSKYAYAALGGNGFEKEKFDLVVTYLPVALGILSAVAFYVAIRNRLGVAVGALGALLLAASPAFLMNALPGVYTPEMLSVAAFLVSLSLFLSADVLKRQSVGVILSVLAGIALGGALLSSEAGMFLAAAFISSAAAQLIYYYREGRYREYAIRFAALAIVGALFVPYAKMPGGLGQLNLENAVGTYVLFLPLVLLFVVVALRDLVEDTKKYELFFLAFALGSAGIALLDPVAAAPGMAIGAVYGIRAVELHRKEKWPVFVFLSLSVGSALFMFISKFMDASRGAVLSLLIGITIGGLFLLYDNEKYRNWIVLAGAGFLVSSILFVGVTVTQQEYVSISDSWGAALVWAQDGLPEGSVLAFVGPEGLSEYVAGKKSCGCDQAVADYLLSGSDTSTLKAAGATHLLVDEAYFGQIPYLSEVANVSRPGLETYFFIAYYQDTDTNGFYAYLLSSSGAAMRIAVSADGTPNGEDALVDGVGAVPYGRLRRFGDEQGPFDQNSKVVLPLYGTGNNLFDIYFETPRGLELVYGAGNETVRIYKVL